MVVTVIVMKVGHFEEVVMVCRVGDGKGYDDAKVEGSGVGNGNERSELRSHVTGYGYDSWLHQ